MRILMIGLIALGAAVSISHAQSQSSAHPIIANEADFRRATKYATRTGEVQRNGSSELNRLDRHGERAIES
jgi:hypothetical protein